MSIDFDSDQQIMANTVLADGKWQFFVGEELLVETQAPATPDRNLLNQWCGIIRERITSRQELDTAEIIARKKARREGYGRDVPDASDTTASNSTVPNKPVPVAEAPAESSPTFDEDPRGYAAGKVEELTANKQRLVTELERTEKLLTKWQAIHKASED
jgi:hypothetical protein